MACVKEGDGKERLDRAISLIKTMSAAGVPPDKGVYSGELAWLRFQQ